VPPLSRWHRGLETIGFTIHMLRDLVESLVTDTVGIEVIDGSRAVVVREPGYVGLLTPVGVQ
jgi:hypothetical protein